MQSRFHPMFYVILPLAVLGFASQFETIWSSMVIPLSIVAVLFLLYVVTQKRPFGTRTSYRPAPRQTRRQPEKPKSKSHANLRVIEGRKNRGDEEPPRYH